MPVQPDKLPAADGRRAGAEMMEAGWRSPAQEFDSGALAMGMCREGSDQARQAGLDRPLLQLRPWAAGRTIDRRRSS